MRDRLVEISLTAPEREFRTQVAELLAATEASRQAFQIFKDRGGATAELYRELGRRGWLSLTWPKTFDGLALPAIYDLLLWDEMAYHRVARPPVGAGMVARSIIDWGTEHQRERFLPGIKSAGDAYALGYSEPQAGSDLTSLRTRARLDGDHYIVTGEKRWTSDAHTADRLWLLCRTGDLRDRSRGLSLLIVDLDSPGITVSPIATLDGHQLNEVRLDDVAVPDVNRIGPEGGAWQMIRAALARERHLQVMPGRVARDLESLTLLIHHSGADDDDMSELATLTSKTAGLHASVRASVRAAGDGEVEAVVAAMNKLVGTSLMQEIARAGSRIVGRAALVEGEEIEYLWRESIMETIAGGTSEMMLDVIAKRGLSTDPRVAR